MAPSGSNHEGPAPEGRDPLLNHPARRWPQSLQMDQLRPSDSLWQSRCNYLGAIMFLPVRIRKNIYTKSGLLPYFTMLSSWMRTSHKVIEFSSWKGL